MAPLAITLSLSAPSFTSRATYDKTKGNRTYCITHRLIYGCIELYVEVLGGAMEASLADDIGLPQLRAGTSVIDILAVNEKLAKAGGVVAKSGGNNVDHFCLQLEPFTKKCLHSISKLRG
jgi:hypothetical protein|tara:strand:+ start:3461 stop:3820 length:360 start_codon:yes stop_codon:yes gene_type:complete